MGLRCRQRLPEWPRGPQRGVSGGSFQKSRLSIRSRPELRRLVRVLLAQERRNAAGASARSADGPRLFDAVVASHPPSAHGLRGTTAATPRSPLSASLGRAHRAARALANHGLASRPRYPPVVAVREDAGADTKPQGRDAPPRDTHGACSAMRRGRRHVRHDARRAADAALRRHALGTRPRRRQLAPPHQAAPRATLARVTVWRAPPSPAGDTRQVEVRALASTACVPWWVSSRGVTPEATTREIVVDSARPSLK